MIEYTVEGFVLYDPETESVAVSGNSYPSGGLVPIQVDGAVEGEEDRPWSMVIGWIPVANMAKGDRPTVWPKRCEAEIERILRNTPGVDPRVRLMPYKAHTVHTFGTPAEANKPETGLRPGMTWVKTEQPYEGQQVEIEQFHEQGKLVIATATYESPYGTRGGGILWWSLPGVQRAIQIGAPKSRKTLAQPLDQWRPL